MNERGPVRVRIGTLRLPPGEVDPGPFVARLGRSLAMLRDGDGTMTADAVAAAVAAALDGAVEVTR